MDKNVARRGFLFSGAALGAGALISACTSNEPVATQQASAPAAAPAAEDGNDAPGEKVVIGFSAPAADHGWIAAISKNAAEAAKQYTDIEFKPVEPTNDINQQISAVESLIQAKVNVLVILPNDGQQLNQVARQAMDAGIPVVNVDRVFPDKLSYRAWIGGDNYGMGVAAGHHIGKTLKDKGVSNPVILEIQASPRCR